MKNSLNFLLSHLQVKCICQISLYLQLERKKFLFSGFEASSSGEALAFQGLYSLLQLIFSLNFQSLPLYCFLCCSLFDVTVSPTRTNRNSSSILYSSQVAFLCPFVVNILTRIVHTCSLYFLIPNAR